jgi:hypothetical protein
MVSTESYLLSLAVGRIYTPRRRCARFRPDLLRPRESHLSEPGSNGAVGTYPVMSDRGLHS